MTLELGEVTKVKSVAAFGCVHLNCGIVKRMQFKDGNGEEVTGYDPYNDNDWWCNVRKDIALAENETLIGVYGAYRKDDTNCFHSLGFIVKVKTAI